MDDEHAIQRPSGAVVRARRDSNAASDGTTAPRGPALSGAGADGLRISDAPRVIGDVGRPRSGPVLVCIGSLHGNEPAGYLALRRVFEALGSDPEGLAGRFVGLTGNRKALAAGRRYLEVDLNRAWTPDRLERVRDTAQPLEAEDDELRELSRALEALIEEEGQITLLDLHTTSGGGPAFTNLDDTLRNRGFAFRLPVPHVLGLEEELAGTLLAHLVARRFVAVGFEAGQHADPASVDRAAAAVWIALEHAGVLRPGSRPEVAEAEALLREHSKTLPDVVEVRYRHPIEPGEQFEMLPGFTSFQRVEKGRELARHQGRPVQATEAGRLLMPLYQRQGEDGFFLIRRVSPFWLWLSAVLRLRGAHRLAPCLPGVRRHPELDDSLTIDKHRARWFALQFFHLLGYRKEEAEDGVLIMTRRDR